MKFLKALPLAALAFWAASCSSSTAPNSTNGTSTAIIQPHSGSVFALNIIADSSNGIITIEKDSVVASGIPYHGETNVNHFVTTNGGSTSDNYLSYRTNGEVAAYLDFSGLGPISRWLVLTPSAAMQTTIFDSTTTLPTGSEHSLVTVTIAPAGLGAFAVGNQTLNTRLYNEDVTSLDIVTTSGVLDTTSTIEHTSFAFAPNIGYVAYSHSATSATAQGSSTTLTSYTLK